jgi:hypothetical protein
VADPRALERGRAIQRARTDPYFYSRWMMLQRTRNRWLRGQHHPIVANTLHRVYRGELTRVIINEPPRYGKTQQLTDWVSWCLGKIPDSAFIYTSYGAELAELNSWSTREVVVSDPYREIFPAVQLREDSQARHHWRTAQDGVVYATGAGGPTTGFGAGKTGRASFGGAIIIDDPHKANEAYSETKREGVIDWFQSALYSRLNTPTTPIVLIMQRLHERDLAGWLLDGGTGEKWEHVCLPAIQPDQTALWPEKHDLETLRRMQSADPHNFAGQYMQQPRPPGGSFFTEAMLLVPSGVLGPDGTPVLVPLEQPRLLNYVFAVIDSAIKTGKEHDGTGVVYFGRSENMGGPPLQVLDWDYQQIQGASLEGWLPSVFLRLEELARECGAILGSKGAWVEDKASGMILLQQAANKEPPLPAWPIESKLSAVGKEERCMNASPQISRGSVKVTRHAYEKRVPYKGAVKNHFMSQALDARIGAKSNAADDLLDCLTYGVALALGNDEGF